MARSMQLRSLLALVMCTVILQVQGASRTLKQVGLRRITMLEASSRAYAALVHVLPCSRHDIDSQYLHAHPFYLHAWLAVVILQGAWYSVCNSTSVACLHLQDAISNSNGCLSTIQKCEPGACATRNVKGTARWVCLRCLANYDPVVDDSGQDNILQCGRWQLQVLQTVLAGLPYSQLLHCTRGHSRAVA